MAGLLKVRLPMLARRLITLVPALVVLGLGVNPTWALVISQVLLSFGIPFALIPLVLITNSTKLMGKLANHRSLQLAAWVVVAMIVALNLALIVLTVIGVN
jgi:manganese transport protein